jgi:Transposase DDE domain
VRLIDSTSVRLSPLSSEWATFSAGVCGAKAHVVYDPDADQPLYLMDLMVTAAPTSTKSSPPKRCRSSRERPICSTSATMITAGGRACMRRIVTGLKANTPFTIVEERPVEAGAAVLSDRLGHLPKRLAASRKNPMSGLVREVRVRIETGKVLRIFTNDLTASAQEIADLYKRRWAIELFFRWVKQTLKIGHFLGTSENAVRTQIIVALIAFVLLRLARTANGVVESPLSFAR